MRNVLYNSIQEVSSHLHESPECRIALKTIERLVFFAKRDLELRMQLIDADINVLCRPNTRFSVFLKLFAYFETSYREICKKIPMWLLQPVISLVFAESFYKILFICFGWKIIWFPSVYRLLY